MQLRSFDFLQESSQLDGLFQNMGFQRRHELSRELIQHGVEFLLEIGQDLVGRCIQLRSTHILIDLLQLYPQLLDIIHQDTGQLLVVSKPGEVLLHHVGISQEDLELRSRLEKRLPYLIQRLAEPLHHVGVDFGIRALHLLQDLQRLIKLSEDIDDGIGEARMLRCLRKIVGFVSEKEEIESFLWFKREKDPVVRLDLRIFGVFGGSFAFM